MSFNSRSLSRKSGEPREHWISFRKKNFFQWSLFHIFLKIINYSLQFLTASGKENRRVSEFFLALLEGSGWYTPNYKMAEPMFWGKGKGCDFLQKPCLTIVNGIPTTQFPDHFCTNLGSNGCSFTGVSMAFCGTTQFNKNTSMPLQFNYFGDWTQTIDGFADNCPYYYGYSNLFCQDPRDYKRRTIDGETFGPGGMCFSGTLGKNSPSNQRSYCLNQTVQPP